jgi:hypothetical protein
MGDKARIFGIIVPAITIQRIIPLLFHNKLIKGETIVLI